MARLWRATNCSFHLTKLIINILKIFGIFIIGEDVERSIMNVFVLATQKITKILPQQIKIITYAAIISILSRMEFYYNFFLGGNIRNVPSWNETAMNTAITAIPKYPLRAILTL